MFRKIISCGRVRPFAFLKFIASNALIVYSHFLGDGLLTESSLFLDSLIVKSFLKTENTEPPTCEATSTMAGLFNKEPNKV
ncbi:MAG: hypothetical protein DRR16_26240 [Candidatus Parabeggiatoa sp. nov. 3]|nr:MAG: hypothetical protein DRQ99_15970 [Gammaproteobacteria bacterium]RKZ79163.1 MAG: hypothetical protein DRR16_26240 [Gammaproteobacteria bacterium]